MRCCPSVDDSALQSRTRCQPPVPDGAVAEIGEQTDGYGLGAVVPLQIAPLSPKFSAFNFAMSAPSGAPLKRI